LLRQALFVRKNFDEDDDDDEENDGEEQRPDDEAQRHLGRLQIFALAVDVCGRNRTVLVSSKLFKSFRHHDGVVTWLHDFNLHNKQNPSVLLSFPDDHFKDHN
jgi:hypothetical protein